MYVSTSWIKYTLSWMLSWALWLTIWKLNQFLLDRDMSSNSFTTSCLESLYYLKLLCVVFESSLGDMQWGSRHFVSKIWKSVTNILWEKELTSQNLAWHRVILNEGLHAKRVYIEFWPIFIFAGSRKFLADCVVLTWKASLCNCFSRFALHSPEITYAKRLSFPLETFCWTKNKRNLLFR